jgi:hypothetical protein
MLALDPGIPLARPMHLDLAKFWLQGPLLGVTTVGSPAGAEGRHEIQYRAATA